MKEKTLKELKAELNNAIFRSSESGGIEHIDLSYEDFFLLIEKIIKRAVYEYKVEDNY